MRPPQKIWIDLDNAPHVHFFAPIVRELEFRAQQPLISIRSFGQTQELARSYGMTYTVVGEHSPHTTLFGRVFETLSRALKLLPFAMRHRPVAAISHGSRALTIAAAALGIPCIALYDYEHASSALFHRLCDRVLVPEVVYPKSSLRQNCVAYPGLKEDVYVHDVRGNDGLHAKLGLDAARLVITVRPPATWAHYHDEHSSVLFRALLERLRKYKDAQVLVLARTVQQAHELEEQFASDEPPFRVTGDAVDGLALIACSDAVFSGGGTMVREAALLGVPAYSTFAGKPGAVDLELERQGKLRVLRTVDEVSKLSIEKRGPHPRAPQSSIAREFILQQILELTN